MIVLNQVVHDIPTNSLEATWVERTIAPDTVVPESTTEYEDEYGVVVLPTTPAQTIPGAVTDVQIKCHSYADVQMQMFRDDVASMGGDPANYEGLIEQIEAGIKPPAPPDPAIRKAAIVAEIAALDMKRIRPMAEGDTIYLGRLTMQIKALRDELKTIG